MGLPIAPLIASRNQLVERVAPRGTATEAFTWPLTALVAGVSLGAAVGGVLVESYSWPAAVLAAARCRPRVPACWSFGATRWHQPSGGLTP